MERGKVLLRKTESGSYIQVGLVTARRGKSLTVRTGTGDLAEQERLPGDITPDVGSYFHLLRLAPEVVERLLDENPTRVFKQLIQDAPGLTASDLKAKVGVSTDAVVNSAWELARPVLGADEDVTTSQGRSPKYRLRDDVRLDFLDLLPTDGPVDPEPVETSPAPESPDRSLADPSSEPEDPEPESLPPAPEVGGTLAARLAPVAPDLDLAAATDVARRPLSISLSVTRLSKAAQKDLIEPLGAADRRLIALIAGNLKGGLLEAEVAQLGTSDYEAVLRAALQEIQARPSPAKAFTEPLTDLLRRACKDGRLPAELLIHIAKVLADRRSSSEGLNLCLVHLAETFAVASAAEIASLDLRGLARAAAASPLTRSGGRVRLLSTLYRVSPDEAVATYWWPKSSLDELANASRSGLAAALDDERVAEHTVAPVVTDYLAGISARSGVAVVWGLPQPLARHVSGTQVAHALARVATHDKLLGSWLATLANADRVRALEATVTGLEEQASRDRETVSRAVAEADELRIRLRTTAEQLAESRAADSGNRDSHDRQVRIDAVRALAVLAAQVKQSTAARSDEALMRQVEHACRREGLEEIGSVDQLSAYDPERHDALSNNLSPGSPVTVVRCGYTWADGDQIVVLVKAHVVAT